MTRSSMTSTLSPIINPYPTWTIHSILCYSWSPLDHSRLLKHFLPLASYVPLFLGSPPALLVALLNLLSWFLLNSQSYKHWHAPELEPYNNSLPTLIPWQISFRLVVSKIISLSTIPQFTSLDRFPWTPDSYIQLYLQFPLGCLIGISNSVYPVPNPLFFSINLPHPQSCSSLQMANPFFQFLRTKPWHLFLSQPYPIHQKKIKYVQNPITSHNCHCYHH